MKAFLRGVRSLARPDGPARASARLLRLWARLVDDGAARFDRAGARARLSPSDLDLLARNARLRDVHRGRRCFVIGNGPSLAQQDISGLGAEITFAMSGFWKHPVVGLWQPSYYSLIDPLFFDGSPSMSEFFGSLRAAIHRTQYFLPLFAKGIIEDRAMLPLEAVSYVALHDSLAQARARDLDLTELVPNAMNVAQFSIMLAIYMGCSPIYLLGLDHDWLAHRGQDAHFYQGTTVGNHPGAHGDLAKWKYGRILGDTLALWQGYEVLLEIADRAGVKIVNATRGGFLDVFERADFEQIVEGGLDRSWRAPPVVRGA